MFREVGRQVSLVPMSRPSPRAVAKPPCLPLDIKDLLKENMGFLMGDFNWLTLAGVSPPQQLSALRTLYIGFRKAKENIGQCKCKDQDFNSYANAVFRRGCCCLSASLNTKALKKLKRKHGTEQV
jgi:hypothetical protein